MTGAQASQPGCGAARRPDVRGLRHAAQDATIRPSEAGKRGIPVKISLEYLAIRKYHPAKD
jgi:hypothetical protein